MITGEAHGTIHQALAGLLGDGIACQNQFLLTWRLGQDIADNTMPCPFA